ncbi:helicase associated domain-containing protein [Gammaproteobacteria bacterium]|nr:helicase associated domain-containing protein [Gammaproteobacteria bacterium]
MDSRAALWEKGYSHLLMYKEEFGHINVRQTELYRDFKLGQWVAVQRNSYTSISAQRRKRLEAIGFIWKPLDAAWERGFSLLVKFKDEYGHVLVEAKTRYEGFGLGGWVRSQRNRRDKLEPDKIKRLEILGFTWSILDENWENGFTSLTTYYQRHGDCLVPVRWVDSNGFKLGTWVHKQRSRKDDMSQQRLEKLNSLGFVWGIKKAGKEHRL